ncbi:hypothetical protein ACTMTJ_13270 [Phytohabitans sp. LJ34]|uniref:hypothetical protein n=1 Tax=Phytohabitans sp. LJ34 TaxID=3452217 RepID=UPI003F8B16A4
MTEVLERRYRRLLAVWYPWEHRRLYEREMLAVLMAGARPEQRWPSARDTANLVGHGLRTRFGAAGTGLAAPAWAEAAAVTALLGALVLLSQRVSRIAEHLVLPGPAPTPTLWLRALAWTAVVAVALAGWRVLAATCAWLTVAAEAVLFARQYQDMPVAAMGTFVPLALGVLVAAGLTLPAPRRRALALLGWARIAVFASALATVHGVYLNNQRGRDRLYDGEAFYVWFGLESGSDAGLYLLLGLVAVAGIAALLVPATLPRPVRWRVLAMVAPIAVALAVIERGLDGWAYSNGHMGHPIYLAPIQWVVLTAGPLLAFALGVLVVHRLEHVRRMVAVGEAAEETGPARD